MFVAFLGTGNALPSLERANTALVLFPSAADRGLMIDCGGDPYRSLLRLGYDAERISDLFITHAHIDHLGGLPSLIESLRIGGRTSPLRIHSHPPTMKVVHELLTTFSFELTLDHWEFPITFHEFTPGDMLDVAGFQIATFATDHSIPSVGIRATADSGSPVIAYTSDTQIADSLDAIAQGANLLIAEATYLDGMEENARFVRHMTARQAATVAAKGGAKALAMVHLSLPPYAIRRSVQQARSVYKGPVYAPADGVVLEVTSRRTRIVRRG